MKVRFGDVVKEVKVNIDRTQNPYEFYVAGDHMDSEDFKIRRRGRFATDDVGPAFTRYFKPGQILYGSRRTYLKKVCVADFEGICANTTFIFETKDANKLDQRMLPFLMLSDGFTKWSIQHSKGSTNPYVLFSDLADYEFDLPPIEKQRELAELLWAANDLKESYKKLIVATDEMLKAKFREMFGDTDKPKFDLISLSEFCHIKHGYAFSGEYFTDDDTGVVLVTPGNFSIGGGFKQDKNRYFSGEYPSDYVLKSGDLIVTMTDLSKSCDTLGYGALVPDDAVVYLHNQRIGLFDVIDSRFDKVFLSWVLRSNSYREQVLKTAAGSTVHHTSPSKILQSMVPLPPLSLQQEFVEIARKADETKAALKKSIADVESVIKGLING